MLAPTSQYGGTVMGLSLVGKTAVVTGGATGIGHAIVVALARAGANVVVGDLNSSTKPGSYDERPDLDVVDLIKSEGHSGLFVRTDVTKPDQVKALADAAVQTFGRLDIWVNNAGIVAMPKKFWEYDDSELDACLNINTKGTWTGMRVAARQMMAQGGGGAIVNMLSTAGIRPHSNQAIYDISKAAAAQATRVAALELGSRGIRVNGVCPTIVKTALSRPFVETSEFQAWIKTILPLGRVAETQQVADAVVFLASDAASAITGVLLPVDNGEDLGPPAHELMQ
jgi:NAD(P)-dependent dehydrogenase (short-subunit alcohol dehydrogenase family)